MLDKVTDYDFIICHYTRVGDVTLFNILGLRVYKRVGNILSIFGVVINAK